jgi:succinoglycan biosynthesis protein ExoA
MATTIARTVAMTKSPLDISVVVPVRNEARFIAETVARLRRQDGADGAFTYEVHFVDGLSDDGTFSVLKEQTQDWPDAHVHTNPARITPVAFNIGIRQARGRYVAILGAHVEIADDYLLSCLRTMAATEADNVGGPWRAKGCGYIGEAIALAFQSPFSNGGAKSHNCSYEGPLDSVWGGFFDRRVFEKIGLFDESLVRNQDDELNLRLVKSGGLVWQSPDISYTYICRDSIPLLFKQYFQYGFWKVRVIQKHRLPASIRHLVPGGFVATVGVLGAGSIFLPLARIGLATVIAAYMIALLAVSVMIAKRKANWRSIPPLPGVLATFHLAYGLGFLSGVWHFVIFPRQRPDVLLGNDLSR